MNQTASRRRGVGDALFLGVIVIIIVIVIACIGREPPHLPLPAVRIHLGDSVALDALGNAHGVVTALLPATTDGERPRFQVRVKDGNGGYQTTTFFLGELYQP